MHDPGDEHVDIPELPLEKDAITLLLEQWEAEGDKPIEMSRDTFDFMMLAESMRECCHHCALEANGEDGS